MNNTVTFTDIEELRRAVKEGKRYSFIHNDRVCITEYLPAKNNPYRISIDGVDNYMGNYKKWYKNTHFTELEPNHDLRPENVVEHEGWLYKILGPFDTKEAKKWIGECVYYTDEINTIFETKARLNVIRESGYMKYQFGDLSFNYIAVPFTTWKEPETITFKNVKYDHETGTVTIPKSEIQDKLKELK